jgi:23S rRNA (cytosine1962-C5)-methyltransferase
MNKKIPELILRPGRERSVLNRHPWIFSGGVARLPKCEEGDWVRVISSEGKLLAHGHIAPKSQITCRIICWGDDPEVQESVVIQERLRTAIRWRESCVPNQTTGYRLIHAEGDFLPGLIVDRFESVLVLQLRTAGMMRLANLLKENLLQIPCVTSLLRRGEGEQGNPEIDWMAGDETSLIQFSEHGFQFLAEVQSGQKTGFFLDQRENRKLLQSYAQNKTVLNTFSYSGAFSVYALAGGAKRVLSVDISGKATELCNQIVGLNFPNEPRHEALTEDCFQFLKDMPEDEFDLIILDPPAFTKHISTVDKATRGYKEINLKAIRKIRPGGILFTFSCSQHISADLFRKIIYGAATDAGREVQVLHRLAQPEDHPVSIYHPEGEYLKGLVLRVL